MCRNHAAAFAAKARRSRVVPLVTLLVLLVGLIALSNGCAVSVEANVMGIDYGSDFIKVAAPRGGDAGVDIVLNEQSRRKVDNYIGFRGEDRYLGEDAKTLAARFPLNAVNMINLLVGITHGSKEFDDLSRQQYLYNIVPHPTRNTLNVTIGNDAKVSYSAEELMAMHLTYFKKMTKNDGFPEPHSAVITIPFHSTLGERQAIVDAAAIAGVEVLGFMHSTTAAALYYGVRRRGFENRTVHLVIYDLGSTHTEVGVYTFTPPEKPAVGRVRLADSFGTLTTKTVVRDETLGGRAFDYCIAEMLEKEAMSKLKISSILKGTTLAERRSKFTLLRAANNAREVLSANSVTPVNVEGIVQDRNLQTSLSRKQFEAECASLFDRVSGIAKAALENANLSTSDVTAFELMGGAARMPKVISDLSTFLGRDVDRTLNMDEAAAIGAAYYATRLSTQFRARSFAINEFVPVSIGFTVAPQRGPKTPAVRTLFTHPHIGDRKSITLGRTEDFSLKIVELPSSEDGVMPPNPTVLGEIQVTGVKKALEELNFFNPTVPHENHSHIVRIQVRVAETGLLKIEEAEVIVNYAVNASKRVKKANVSATTTTTTTTAEEKEGASTASDAGGKDTANEPPTKTEEQQYETKYVIQMRQKSEEVVAVSTIAHPPSLTPEDLDASKKRVAAIQEREEEKRAVATSKNNLETYILWAKLDGIVDNTELREAGVMTEEEAEEIRSKLMAAQEWLEDGDGATDECTKEMYDEKLAQIREETSGPVNRLKALRSPKKVTEENPSTTESEKDAVEEQETETENGGEEGGEGDSGNGDNGDDKNDEEANVDTAKETDSDDEPAGDL